METGSVTAEVRDVARYWWLGLVFGIGWLIISLIVLRFDATSVKAVGILAGVVFIGAGISDLILGSVADKHKVWWYLIGSVLIIVGIVALFHPQNTFLALSAVVGWFLLFKGTFDIALALMQRDYPLWWITLVVGIIEILLAFWAAGYFGRKAALVIIFVAASAMARGVMSIVFAFRLRELGKTG